MELLDPNEIKDSKKESAQKSQKIIISLSEEEARLNKEVNLLREHADKQKKDIKEEVDRFIESQIGRKEALEGEVAALEARKTEALKPVYDTRSEADEYLKKAKLTLEIAEKKEKEADAKYEEIVEQSYELKDKADELTIREGEIGGKEDRVKAEESRLKDSANALTEKWAVFHEATANANAEFAMREKKIQDSEKTLEIRQAQQDAREKEQNDHDRAIKDKYDELGRAVEEVKKKYNVSI